MSSADQARLLVAEKEAIEAELDKQLQILNANSADMRTPLVDAQGFPRDDIDVFLVRGARVRIIELRNDLTAVMDRIAKQLERVYAPSPPTESDADMKAATTPEMLLPFARVDGIAPGSPASEAVCSQSIVMIKGVTASLRSQGLQREDLVIKFGHLTRESFTASSSLSALTEVVGASENASS